MVWITIPRLRKVLWMAWHSQCEPGWNIVCDGNMHGCEKVLRIPWLRVCAPKHMDDCEPNSRAPFLTGRHGWLKIQSKCKQKLSNTHGWITKRPTQCLSGRRNDGSDMEWFWDGEKSPTKKIKFGSFALQWTGLLGEKQDTAMLQGMVALQVPYNQSIMHSAILNLIAYA